MQATDDLSIRDGVVNLCNCCIGIGILAKPFALAITGWRGIIAIFFAAILVTYAGICLADASKEFLIKNKASIAPIVNSNTKQNHYNSTNSIQNNVQKSKKPKSAYQLVTYHSLGKHGEIYAILGFTGIALIICATCVIMVFELIQQIIATQLNYTYIDSRVLFLSSFIFYLPLSLVLNWKHMTFISWIGVMSVLVLLCTLIGLFILSLYQFNGPPPAQLLLEHIEHNSAIMINSTDLAINARSQMSSFEQFFFSFVIFVSGIAGNGAVPKILASLKRKDRVIWVVAGSYVMVSIFYCVIACIGYWIYGGFTDVMIINNFFIWPNGWIVIIVSICVMLNLWSSFAIMLSLVSDIFDSILHFNMKQFGYRRIMRLSILSFVFALSFLLRNHLAFLVTLGGIIGVLCSLALTIPIVIYLATFWKHDTRPLSMMSKTFHIILLIICVVIGCLSAYNDFENIF